MSRRLRRLPALILAALCASAAGADDEVVTRTDGVRVRGEVKAAGVALRILAGDREVYVPPALVAKRARVSGPPAPVPHVHCRGIVRRGFVEIAGFLRPPLALDICPGV